MHRMHVSVNYRPICRPARPATHDAQSRQAYAFFPGTDLLYLHAQYIGQLMHAI